MFTNRFVTITATFVVTITGTVNADGEDTPAQAVPVEVFPLPANTVFERHVVSEGVTTTATGERLIYSNTLGTFAAAPGTNKLFADDIATTTPNGCKLRRLEFPVVGKVNPAGTGGSYTVDFALYSNCPGSVPSGSRPGLIIPGTQGQRTFTDQCQNATDDDSDTVVNDGCPAVGPAETGAQCENTIDDDGDGKVNDGCPADGTAETDVDSVPRLISFVPAVDTLLPTNFWFGVKFSRANSGVIVGAPALVGFSADGWYFPGFPCNVDNGGGFPEQPHASFNAEIFVDTDCADAFVGYKNSNPSGPLYNPGADVFLADDIQLGVGECQMIAYEVAVRGEAFYTFKMQNNCESGLIAGTERTFLLIGPTGTETRIARFAFDPPIAIPQDLWFAVKVNNTTGSVVIAGQQASIGATADRLDTVVNNLCNQVNPYDLGIGIRGAVNLTITCAGAAPAGACCDMVFTDANGEAVCREGPQMNCPWPPRFTSYQPAWVEGASCEPDPFPLPCGLAACCRPDQVCENLTQNECNAVPPLDGPRQWQKGRYCGVDWQSCPWMACFPRIGDCMSAREEPGCQYPDCCAAVCDADSYCCLVEWDRVCVERANTLCPYLRGHDECSNPHSSISALPVEADSVTVFSNIGATESAGDPGFCCRSDVPGAVGFGTTWFKFVATDTSARVSTFGSDPTGDSLIDVFAVGDPTTEETACNSLTMIGCSDDVEGCSTSGHHGRVCIKGLAPGDTYYVMLAAKTPETKGLYQLDIRSPCFEEPIWNPNDCNENKLPDGCELGSGASSDCNGNNIPDECDIAEGTDADCNGNHVPDACDLASEVSRDCQPNGVPDECDITIGASFDCDDDGLPDECAPEYINLVPEHRYGFLGYAVSLDGTRALVSDTLGLGLGAAHVFRHDKSGWIEEAELRSPSAVLWDGFGEAVSLSGDWALIAAPGDHPDGQANHGAVYAFHREGPAWGLEGKLVEPDPRSFATFGLAVAHDRNRAVIVATDVPEPGFCYDQCFGASSAVVFRRAANQWIRETKINRPDPEVVDSFASAVAIDGSRLAIGAPGTSAGSTFRVGAVYIFAEHAGAWNEAAVLTPTDGEQDDYFGAGVSLDGDLLAVGAPGHAVPGAGCCGAVYLFRSTSVGWMQEAVLAPPAGVSSFYFGLSVSVAGQLIAVAPALLYSGEPSAFLFERVGNTWIESLRFTINEPQLADASTASISLTPTSLILGADTSNQDEDGIHGLAHLFPLPDRDCNANTIPDACDLRYGTSADCDANGVPDECETLPPFDYDFDGDVDLIDLAGFQRCFTGHGPAELAPCCTVFDFERDGDVDLADFVGFRRVFSGP